MRGKEYSLAAYARVLDAKVAELIFGINSEHPSFEPVCEKMKKMVFNGRFSILEDGNTEMAARSLDELLNDKGAAIVNAGRLYFFIELKSKFSDSRQERELAALVIAAAISDSVKDPNALNVCTAVARYVYALPQLSFADKVRLTAMLSDPYPLRRRNFGLGTVFSNIDEHRLHKFCNPYVEDNPTTNMLAYMNVFGAIPPRSFASAWTKLKDSFRAPSLNHLPLTQFASALEFSNTIPKKWLEVIANRPSKSPYATIPLSFDWNKLMEVVRGGVPSMMALAVAVNTPDYDVSRVVEDWGAAESLPNELAVAAVSAHEFVKEFMG